MLVYKQLLTFKQENGVSEQHLKNNCLTVMMGTSKIILYIVGVFQGGLDASFTEVTVWRSYNSFQED